MHYKSCRIISWNINSLRLRIDMLADLVRDFNPDIIALQETKVMDQLFPSDAIKEMGFIDMVFSGEKSYNGVAILSRSKIASNYCIDFDGTGQKRHISCFVPEFDLNVTNLYIPAGGDEPDAAINPKFAQKLKFLNNLTKFFDENSPIKLAMMGDFNIAPSEFDVWSHKALKNVVSHTEPEITRLNLLQSNSNFIDTHRHLADNKQRLYSWWSYRSRDWQQLDHGRRLDHIWLTPDLESRLLSAEIVTSFRGLTRPSDHVPIIVDLK